MFITNMPRQLYLTSGDIKFHIGDRIRILLQNHNQYMAELAAIEYDSITINVLSAGTYSDPMKIMLYDIKKVRLKDLTENLNNTPYFDDEEREFWKTHWVTKDGIKKKTPEDIKELEKFFKSQDN